LKYIIKWLIDYLRFYVPLKNISLIWRRHHYRWRAAKFRPMLGAQGLWAGRDLYHATPAVTRDLSFSGLIWGTAPFSRLLRHTRGCGGSILTRIKWRTKMIMNKMIPIYCVGTRSGVFSVYHPDEKMYIWLRIEYITLSRIHINLYQWNQWHFLLNILVLQTYSIINDK
jgi:hypothetical protein